MGAHGAHLGGHPTRLKPGGDPIDYKKPGWSESTRAQGFYAVKTLVRRKRRPISDGAPKEPPAESHQ